MSAAQPLPIDRSELDVAVEKLRARRALTERERELVNARGMELLADDLTDEPPPGADLDDQALEDDDDAVLEDAVLADADERDGIKGTPWREYFASRGIAVPPVSTE
jgi:hypothetical protein